MYYKAPPSARYSRVRSVIPAAPVWSSLSGRALDEVSMTFGRTILFDLDGTLTDSSLGITNSVIYALKALGIEPPERKELYKFIGLLSENP
jgi:hypothetical protein